MKMDYYDLLELNDNCTKEEIKKQYHKLSKKYHPDKNNGNDTQFKEIKEAFDILYDEESRKKYNIQRIFKEIEFSDEEYELLNNYYYNFINSNEFILIKKLYKTIPISVKENIKKKYLKTSQKKL